MPKEEGWLSKLFYPWGRDWHSGNISRDERDMVEAFQPYANRMLAVKNLPPDIAELVKKSTTQTEEFPFAVLGGFGLGMGSMIVSQMMMPLITPVIQQMYQLVPSTRLAVADAIRANFRRLKVGEVTPEGFEFDATLIDDLTAQGFNEERIATLQEAMRPLFTLSEVKDLFLRGELGAGDAGKQNAMVRLHSLGYKTGDAEQLIKLFYLIPPAPDLIRMAVREVFTPEIVEKFGQLEDFPEDFAVWAEKVGLSREWAQFYWGAHWDLPSTLQAFEMFHREAITEDELKMLLRALDIMPFWRDKLTQIAYRPYTRVDVRRMHKVGVLSEKDVFTAYKHLGYDDTKAGKMADFTIEYNKDPEKKLADDDRELTKAEILRGYREMVLEEGEVRDNLDKLEYDGEQIDFYLALEDARIEAGNIADEVIYLRDAFTYGKITRATLADEMGKLNLPARQSDYLLEKFDREFIKKLARPSKTDFLDWLKKGLITLDNFYWEMRLDGYSDYYIELYVKEVKK